MVEVGKAVCSYCLHDGRVFHIDKQYYFKLAK